MFKRRVHKRLVERGAPPLPPGYFYHPVGTYVEGSDRPLLRMEIRRRDGIWSTVVSSWTVDPETYFAKHNDLPSVSLAVNLLCLNAIRACEDFEVEEVNE